MDPVVDIITSSPLDNNQKKFLFLGYIAALFTLGVYVIYKYPAMEKKAKKLGEKAGQKLAERFQNDEDDEDVDD